MHIEQFYKPRELLDLVQQLGLPANGANPPDDDDAEDPSHVSTFSQVTPDYAAGTGQGPEIEHQKAANAPAVPVSAPSPPRPKLTPGLANVYDAEVWQTKGRLQPIERPVAPHLVPMGMRYPAPNNANLSWGDIAGVLPGMKSVAPIMGMFPTPWNVSDIGAGLRNLAGKMQWPDAAKKDPLTSTGLGALLGGAGLAGLSFLNNAAGQPVQYNTPAVGTLGLLLGSLAGYNKFRTNT